MRRALLAVAVLALAVPAQANAFSRSDLRLPMDDGVELAATYYVPDGPPPAGGYPAVLMLHGIGETRSDETNGVGMSINSVAERYLVPQGYVVLTFDARGHGDSGGLVSVDGPREVADVRGLFNWLASRPGVNSSRVGAYGYSYGGGALWRAAVEGVPFAALEISIAWTDLYAALVPQNLARSGVVLGFYQSIAARVSPEVDTVLKDALQGTNLASVRAFTAARSSRSLLGRIRAPVFLMQGRRDFAFDLDHALDAYRRLKVPKRLYIAGFGHAPSAKPAGELDYVLPRGRMWFDRFLKGLPNGIDRPPAIELAPDPWTGRTAKYRTLPARRTIRLTYKGRSTIGSRGKVARTQRLPRSRLETFGAPTLEVPLASPNGWPHVVAVLSALTPQGKEIVVSSGGARVKLRTRPQLVAIKLISQVTAIPARSRLRLTIAAASTAQSPGNLLYLTKVPDNAELTVGTARVSVPVLLRPVSR